MSKRTQLLRNMKHKNKEGYSIILGKEERDICIEALEKQVAKKVIIPSTDLGKYYHQESCPNCKKEFSVGIAGYKFKDVIGKTNYCHNCGQRIDWSEVE